MDETPKRKTTRLQGYDYSTPGAYFLTLCTENRQCILSRIVGTGVLDGPPNPITAPVGTGVLDGPPVPVPPSILGGPQIHLLPYGKIADKYIRQLHNFYDNISVESYVIMPNHIHILLFVKEDGPSRTPVPTTQNSTVSRFISTFKRFCNKESNRNIWQSRSYDHVIRDQEDFDKHLKYIQENPAKWESDKLYYAE